MKKEKGSAFIHRSSKTDDYNTHYSLTWQLLERENFEEEILEPACGNMAIAYQLRDKLKKPCRIIFGDIKIGQDFLIHPYEKVKYIITNPPYTSKLIDKFVIRAKELYTGKIAFLCRLDFYSGYQRYRAGIFNELARIYVFTRRPDLRAPIRPDGKYPTAAMVYAWFIWQHGYIGPTIIRHIDNQRYVLKK